LSPIPDFLRRPNMLAAHRIMDRSAQPGDEVSSCLVPCIFRFSALCVSGLPRTPHPAAASATEVSSCPEPSVLRPCRRWIFKSPQISHSFSVAGLCEVASRPVSSRLLAAPAMKASGFPSSLTSGFTGDGSPSCLKVRILRRCRLADFRVAPNFGLSVSPTIRVPGCPVPRILRSRLMVLRVASDYAPSGFASGEYPGCPELLSSGTPINQFPGCPKSWVSRRRRLINLRVTPNFVPSADPSPLPQVAPIPHRRLDR